jgi:hypothetical protein
MCNLYSMTKARAEAAKLGRALSALRRFNSSISNSSNMRQAPSAGPNRNDQNDQQGDDHP